MSFFRSQSLDPLNEIASVFALGYLRVLANQGELRNHPKEGQSKTAVYASLFPLDSSGERSDLSAPTQQGNLF